MSPILASRVLAVANLDRSLLHIDVWPFNSTDFLLPHCGRHRKANNPTERNELSWVAFGIFDQFV